MILNVSGRCDVVAFYSKWFMNRYKIGFIDVRNPIYPKLVYRINFSDVDCIVFCTKNPIPIIDELKNIKIPIIFHVTITPYKKDIEPNVINKKTIIEAVKKISKIIGKDNLFIRYDPIFISKKYTIDYHIKAFDKLCSLLDGYTNHIIISFIDMYKNVLKNKDSLGIIPFTEKDYKKIGINFSNSCKKHNMTVQTCSEEENLTQYGFIKRDCVDYNLIFRLTGKTKFPKWKSRNNKNCGCVSMVDIGSYNSCSHFCKYCYANYNQDKVLSNMKLHDDNSSLLIGNLNSDDIIKERK